MLDANMAKLLIVLKRGFESQASHLTEWLEEEGYSLELCETGHAMLEDEATSDSEGVTLCKACAAECLNDDVNHNEWIAFSKLLPVHDQKIIVEHFVGMFKYLYTTIDAAGSRRILLEQEDGNYINVSDAEIWRYTAR